MNVQVLVTFFKKLADSFSEYWLMNVQVLVTFFKKLADSLASAIARKLMPHMMACA